MSLNTSLDTFPKQEFAVDFSWTQVTEEEQLDKQDKVMQHLKVTK